MYLLNEASVRTSDFRHLFFFSLVSVCSVDTVLSYLNSPFLYPTLLSFIPLPEVIVMQTVKVVMPEQGSPSVYLSGVSWDFWFFRTRLEDGKLKSVFKLEVHEITVILLNCVHNSVSFGIELCILGAQILIFYLNCYCLSEVRTDFSTFPLLPLAYLIF